MLSFTFSKVLEWVGLEILPGRFWSLVLMFYIPDVAVAWKYVDFVEIPGFPIES